jgi:uncharacterized protein
MLVRNPDIQPGEGPLVWSRIPEFALMYNAFSVIIPYVEFYLNNVMQKVRADYCANDAALAEELDVFIKQETIHAKYHMRFNQRMFDQNIPGLKELIERTVAELKALRETRSLGFNTAYCAGFECIATFASRYLYEECDHFFAGCDPHGANLLLWHVGEEFEHRTTCHATVGAVSGNYFTRMHGLFYAFRHVGGAFMEAERLVLAHHNRDKSEAERNESQQRRDAIFRRKMRYLIPRMLQILLPGYNPARLKTPPRIRRGLEFFRAPDRIDRAFIEYDLSSAASA